ncbi:MAG: hypothetical protein ABI980_01535 [Nitrospirota bacterium]
MKIVRDDLDAGESPAVLQRGIFEEPVMSILPYENIGIEKYGVCEPTMVNFVAGYGRLSSVTANPAGPFCSSKAAIWRDHRDNSDLFAEEQK